MVICDHWCYIVIVLGYHELHSYEMVNLISKYCVCSDFPCDWPFPSLSLQAGLLFPEVNGEWWKVTQSCPTFCDPMDMYQALPPWDSRQLEWIAISFSGRSSQPRDWTQVSCIVGFTALLSEPPGKSVPWDTVILKLDQLITVQWLIAVQMKGRVTWYFKLEIISKEVMLKGEIILKKTRPITPVSQLVNAKFCRKIKVPTPVNTRMIRKKVKQLDCWYGEYFSVLKRRSNHPQHSVKSFARSSVSSILWRLREARNLQKKSLNLL